MKKAKNLAFWLIFIYGFGWAGEQDFKYREGQVKKELARIHKQEGYRNGH